MTIFSSKPICGYKTTSKRNIQALRGKGVANYLIKTIIDIKYDKNNFVIIETKNSEKFKLKLFHGTFCTV